MKKIAMRFGIIITSIVLIIALGIYNNSNKSSGNTVIDYIHKLLVIRRIR